MDFQRFDVVVPSRRAIYRMSDREPMFLVVTTRATDVVLVRLRPGDDQDDRNLRVIGPTEKPEDSIPVEHKLEVVKAEESGGLVQLTFRLPLQAGEYAIVNQTKVSKMFDFGVD